MGNNSLKSKAVIEVDSLAKKFSDLTAVSGISFHLNEGEILGLLGPNGAGKTTTISMLLGLIKPTSGKIKIFGKEMIKDRVKILENVGFSSAYTSMQSRLTVHENLYVFGYYYGIGNATEKIDELLAEFSMNKLSKKLYGSLSSGQKTRVNLIRALIHEPKLLLLDEPTASLDPDIAERVKDFLFRVRRKRNIAILYTSHDMEEVAQMCDRIIILDKGKIVAEDTPLELTKIIRNSLLTVYFDAPLERVKSYAKANKLSFKISQPNILTVNLPTEDVGRVLTGLAKAEIGLIDVDVEKPNLQDVFIKIARKEAR
jgi:ABC-2 type transport system ATP-binding protein